MVCLKGSRCLAARMKRLYGLGLGGDPSTRLTGTDSEGRRWCTIDGSARSSFQLHSWQFERNFMNIHFSRNPHLYKMTKRWFVSRCRIIYTVVGIARAFNWSQCPYYWSKQQDKSAQIFEYFRQDCVLISRSRICSLMIVVLCPGSSCLGASIVKHYGSLHSSLVKLVNMVS
jgi:hypothetical protein